MVSPGPTDSRNDQAALWAVRASSAGMSAADRVALDAWLAADRRNRGAYLRCCAGMHALGELGASTSESARLEHEAFAPARPAAPRPASNDDEQAHGAPSRRAPGWLRGSLLGGGALAASLAIVAQTGLFNVSAPVSPAAESHAAAVRVLKLQDGSVAHLRPGADIAFDMSGKVRKIRLISGQAVFEVAKDAARPFVVQSGDVYAQATGTVYSVNRIGATGGSVHVTEGSVLVWARDERDQAVLLHPGGRLSLDPGPRPAFTRAPAPPVAPEPVIAQISLDNTPIAAAAERFNRVNQTQILITDPAIGEIKIVGLFRANEPDRFARAAAAVAGAEMVHDKDNNVIKLK